VALLRYDDTNYLMCLRLTPPADGRAKKLTANTLKRLVFEMDIACKFKVLGDRLWVFYRGNVLIHLHPSLVLVRAVSVAIHTLNCGGYKLSHGAQISVPLPRGLNKASKSKN